jgi:hypothetical protein
MLPIKQSISKEKITTDNGAVAKQVFRQNFDSQ